MSTERAPDRTRVGAIAAGDVDAAAGFYDAHAGSVHEACAELCPPSLVDDATISAFVDFLGRARRRSDDADAGELLRRATRTAVASRMSAAEWQPPTCRGAAEVIAGSINGDLARDDEPLRRHLEDCGRCREVAVLLAQVDRMLDGTPERTPPESVREAWLELVAAPDAIRASEEPTRPEPPSPDAPQPSPPVHGRARRGGLVGAARRIASVRGR